NDIWGYTINAAGALTVMPESPFPAGTEPVCVAVDPTGKFVYVANLISNNVSGYTINAVTGALTAIPGSPFLSGDMPTHVSVDPTGKFAYVANLRSNDVSGFAIDAGTGTLTAIPGSPFVGGVGWPEGLAGFGAVDPTGK